MESHVVTHFLTVRFLRLYTEQLTFIASPATPHGIAVAADESLSETGNAFSVDAFRCGSRSFATHPVQVGASGEGAL